MTVDFGENQLTNWSSVLHKINLTADVASHTNVIDHGLRIRYELISVYVRI